MTSNTTPSTATDDHDPLCPSSEVPDSGCLCLWIRDARADERERIAQAIEADAYRRARFRDTYHALLTAARIARATP